MTRPRKIDDEQILETTRKVLGERGVHVPTRMLAAEIGISEGILFQRFKSKEGLLQAALSLPSIDFDRLVTEACTGEGVCAALENIAEAIFLAFRRIIPRSVPRLSQPEFGRELNSRNSPFMKFVVALEKYLLEQRHQGRISTDSPYRTSYLIVSTLHHAALLESFAGPSDDISEGTIRDTIRIIWQGIQPRDKKTTP